MKTCDKCQHYTPTDAPNLAGYANAGCCALIGDSNDNPDERVAVDRVAAWDRDSYRAGAYVGPKFGCIHWAKK